MSFIHSSSTSAPVLFLTFDDGPSSHTPEILHLLHRQKARALFFCTGKQVEQFPYYYNQILQEGHLTGNHSYSHLNGWKTFLLSYLQDVKKASSVIHSPLFRPPYGKISPLQYLFLRTKYQLVWWDILVPDYNVKLTGDKCFDLIRKKIRSHAVIVFHDSEKAYPRNLWCLNKLFSSFPEYTFPLYTK